MSKQWQTVVDRARHLLKGNNIYPYYRQATVLVLVLLGGVRVCDSL